MTRPAEQTPQARGLLTTRNKTVETWVGADYSINKPQTVGDLKAILAAIIADLPDDDSLEISEVHLHNNTMEVTLTEGIVQ